MTKNDRRILGTALVVLIAAVICIVGAIRAWGQETDQGQPETVTVEATPRFGPSTLSTGASRLRVVGTIPIPVDRRGRVEIDVDGDGEWEVRADLGGQKLRLRIEDCVPWKTDSYWVVECGG